MTDKPSKVGLSLSGGGYRAAAFHLGTIKKLKQMDLLEKVDIISTISGGSIIGAYYCLHKDDYDVFEAASYGALTEDDVIKRVLLSVTSLPLLLLFVIFMGPAFYFLFTSHAWLFPLLLTAFIFVLVRFQFHIFPVSRGIERAYDAFFYAGRKLHDLPEHPELVISSTNMQTSRPFIFSKTRMGDSTYDYLNPPVKFKGDDFPISRAVMASSCVPFAFTPIKIDVEYFETKTDAHRVHPILVDGGVFDNQGIHKLTQKGRYTCTHIIASDAGAGSSKELSFGNTISLLISTVDVFMSRIKKAQMAKDIYENTAAANKEIAFFSLGWKMEEIIPGFIDNLANGHITSSVIEAHQLLQEWVAKPSAHGAAITAFLENRTGYASIEKPTEAERAIACSVGTNLTALSKRKVNCLMKQAAALTELQVKLYCPSLLIRTA